MRQHVKELVVLLGLGGMSATLGCDAQRAIAPAGDDSAEQAWSALMVDGEVPAAMAGAGSAMMGPPPRSCGDCTRAPLAFWSFDDCNATSTLLADTAFSAPISHPAFRAVSVACAAGEDGAAVKLAADGDIVYAPDQPDFRFDQGLTVAAWINPVRVTGTQSIIRKRLDGSSSFVLAISGGRLHALVRLTNGQLAGASASIRAGRFTHVAATYDGQQILLYIDGAVAAHARAAGTIAAGAGPIFVGNDINGRRFEGIVDSVWLNTLAAPPDVIGGLTCVRKPPLVALSPATTPPQTAGAAVPFDLSVSNTNSNNCPVDSFEFFASSMDPRLGFDPVFGVVSAGPGQTAHATINVTSARSAQVGSYAFSYFVLDEAAPQISAEANATYVVGTGAVACQGSPPFTPQITGVPFGPAGGTFTFQTGTLVAPTLTPQLGPDGSTQAIQISASPGTTTDILNSAVGFGFFFVNPTCVDASAFTGVRFNVTGDLGTCELRASVVPSEDNAVANGPVGTCTAASCVSPFSAPLGLGTQVVRFADMTGGAPLATVDATALNDVLWTLTVPTDGVTAPCTANLTISDVSFVSDAVPPGMP